MAYPPLVHYVTEQEYRDHFERVYCQAPIQTFDGIDVRFQKRQFDHSFFESVNSNDDTFSIQRAERIDWVKAALEDPGVELYLGYDNKKKKPAKDRRVAIVMGDHVVVIQVYRAGRARFITAFVAGRRAIYKIRNNPVWA